MKESGISVENFKNGVLLPHLWITEISLKGHSFFKKYLILRIDTDWDF